MPDAPASPDAFALVHTSRARVRWSDMDALGHVNNAVYFTYIEQARAEAMEAMITEWHTGGRGPVLIHASCTYKRPVKHPATVVIRVFVGAPGRSSLPTRYEITVEGDEDRVYATGEATLVWIDLEQERPVPLPPALREAVEERLAAQSDA